MFSYPALLWALPVVGLVVLIHLINMFRHRHVPWAAMEFLLAGYKKSRMRILLRQFLLIALRCLAVVALILMLAQPNMRGPLADLIAGTKPTLHFVLLDDSFSMSDRNAGQVAMDEACGVVERIVQHARQAGKDQKLSLLRFSRCAGQTRSGMSSADGTETDAGMGTDAPDFDELRLDEEGFEQVRRQLETLHASQTAAGPEDALTAAVKRFSAYATNYRGIVYLVSDFRSRDWEHRESLRRRLLDLKDRGIGVRLIRVIETHHSNLAIRQVKPVPGIHAAEVPVLLDATIANFGAKTVENVHFDVSVDGRSQSGQNIPVIEPGREASVRFPIRLSGDGEHRIRVQLEPDAIACDNEYALVLNIPRELSVLILQPDVSDASDGAQTGSGAAYLRTALSPEGVRTGIRAQVESFEFLATNEIGRFNLVILLDLPRMEPTALRALETYVNAGGAVAFFTGPETDPHFVNERLYRNGEGVFPVSLLAPEALLPDYLVKEPDLSVSEHPMFRMFARDGAALLRAVTVDRFFAVDANSFGQNGENVTVLGRLRNRSPLIFESEFGRGRVVTFLTSAAPLWNDWGRGNPSFVITMLEMVAYLATAGEESAPLRVGDPIVLRFDSATYAEKAELVPPEIEVADQPSVAAKPVALEALPHSSGMSELRFDATARSGFYRIVLTHRLAVAEDGGSEVRTVAVNVDAGEGNLALEERAALSDMLHPLEITLEEASTFAAPWELTVAESLSDVLLFLLIVLLCLEILIAGRLLPPQKRTTKNDLMTVS